jgi:hypothetical protein
MKKKKLLPKLNSPLHAFSRIYAINELWLKLNRKIISSYAYLLLLGPTVLLVLGPRLVFSQCMLYPVSLEERVRESRVIFEGEVMGSRCFWNQNKTQIYTAHLLKVYKIFKGSIRGSSAVIVTQGGIVGNSKLVVYPSLQLKEGKKGIFMTKDWPENTPFGNVDAFVAYADEQGFIELDYFNDEGREPFNTYPSIQEGVYHKLGTLLGKSYSIIQELEEPKLDFRIEKKRTQILPFAPSNITFTPASLSAETGSVLTIKGNNFGTMTGAAKVQLKNANDGGNNWVDVPSSYITLWTNTQITLILPNWLGGGATPGSGPVKVINSDNQQGVSAATLTITFNVSNTSSGHLRRLYNQNTSGGYTFHYSADFISIPARLASFQRALQSWRCATFVSFEESCIPTSSNVCNDQNDKVNIVNMDFSCPLQGPLGVCYTSFIRPAGCWKIIGMFLILILFLIAT